MSVVRALLSALLVLVVLALPAAFAGEPLQRDVDDLEDLLPRHETAAERLRWLGREDLLPRRDAPADPPPVGPVRNVAEWEPATGVLIRYPLGLPYALLRDFDDDVTLHVIVSSTYQATAQANLQANGVDMARVQFLVRANDSIWTRDYGPWFVVDGNGVLTVVDHVYNRPWRPNDNLIPIAFAQQQGLPVVSHDMCHTGGNYMTDGSRLGMSTRLVYDEALAENGLSAAQVDQLMGDYYGLQSYQVLEYIESGGIHHIDTWAKFLDEETVLLKRVWSGHHTYATLEQRAVLLASLISATGRPYDVRRIDCNDIGWSDPAAFTNSLILNDRIYVPLFGDAAADSAALRTYRDAAPGYDVRGYYYSGFLTDDALHCRAKAVFDREMLQVRHIPLEGPVEGPAVVDAEVSSLGGHALTAVTLHWRLDGGPWQQAPMADQGGGLFRGLIPAPDADAAAEYYVLAEDASGRVEGSPRPAPAAAHAFTLQAAVSAADGPARPRLAGAVAPNPFNPSTTYAFELGAPTPVSLTVLDPRGRLVRRLLDGAERPAGPNSIRWDGRDDAGREVPSGTYLFVIEALGLRHARPAVLVR